VSGEGSQWVFFDGQGTEEHQQGQGRADPVRQRQSKTGLPLESSSLPENGRMRLLPMIPSMQAVLKVRRSRPVLVIRKSVNTPTPIVCPGMRITVPTTEAARITQP